MSNNEKIPKIRFKGFTEDWEQRKLDRLLEQYTEVTTINNQYPVLTSSRKGIFFQTEYFAGNQIASQNNVGYNIVPRNYFTYRHMSDDEIFHFNINDICDFGIVSTLYPVFTTKKELDSKYLQYQLNYGKEFAKFASLQKQGGSRTYMYFAKLKELVLTMPKVEEQTKISSILSNIDNLITLHQRKCDKLINVKKSMLEKMFPQNDEKIPKIRFKGFTEDWEQRNVTDIGKISIGLVTTMTSHYTNKGTLLIRNSDIKDNYFEFGDEPIYLDYEFANKNSNRKHQIGDVITVHTGDVGTSAVIKKNTDKSIGFATIITRPIMSIIDSYYLSIFLNTEKHKKWAVAISTGDGRTNYNLRDYQKLFVPLTSLEEQKKIAAFITNIDNLITLHQRKLEMLKNVKKSMLDKMFV